MSDITAESESGTGRRGVPATTGRERVVAVTGASSFLGRNLIGILELDRRVRRIVSVDLDCPPEAGAKTRHYAIDLGATGIEERLFEVLEAEHVDQVAHLSFLSTPTPATALAHELESVGTMRLLNACRRAEVKKLVMASHTALYGAHPTNPNYLSERHPLRAKRDEAFFSDKLDAEHDALRFGTPGSGRMVTVLRMAPILGPTIENYFTRYLGLSVVPTVLGFDPLWQFLHEADALAALHRALVQDVPGIFNIVGTGVLPLSKVIRLTGRPALPLPRSMNRLIAGTAWALRLSDLPPSLTDYLTYLCVADGTRARKELGFSPMYSSREAVIDYSSAQRMRDAKLLSERAA